VVVFLRAFLIVKVPRPMLAIFAAAMSTPNRIGATSPTKSPRTIVDIFILVPLKLLTDDRGLGKGAVKNARPLMSKPHICDEARRLYRVGDKM
jgi:hypothetical protein